MILWAALPLGITFAFNQCRLKQLNKRFIDLGGASPSSGQKSREDFKILAIDGGGMRGIYAATMLEQMENLYGPIYKHFQMICGTSTGGIIALALAIGVPAGQVLKFYEEHGPSIFPGKSFMRRFWQCLRRVTRGSKYNNATLRRALEQILVVPDEDGTRPALMEDAKCRVCIPATDLQTFGTAVFKTPHADRYFRDAHLRMVDIALATSAAPWYLPTVEIQNTGMTLVDGGLWANNPAMVGLIEGISHFVGPNRTFKSMRILSIGNLSCDKGWPYRKWKRWPLFWKWISSIMSLTLNAQAKSVDNMLNVLQNNDVSFLRGYTRIPEPDLTDEDRPIARSLDRSDTATLKRLKDLAIRQAYKYVKDPQVSQFFDQKVDLCPVDRKERENG